MVLKRRNVEVEEHDKDKIRELMMSGFEPLEAKPEELAPETAEELASMTVKELRAVAEARGLKLSRALKKQDIIDILEETNDSGTEDSTAEQA